MVVHSPPLARPAPGKTQETEKKASRPQAQQALVVPARATKVQRVGKSATDLRRGSGPETWKHQAPDEGTATTTPRQQQQQQAQPPKKPPLALPPPAQSSEYLDRYKTTKPVRSVVAPSSLAQRARPGAARQKETEHGAVLDEKGRNNKDASRETAQPAARKPPVGVRTGQADGGGDGVGELEAKYLPLMDELKRVFRGRWSKKLRVGA